MTFTAPARRIETSYRGKPGHEYRDATGAKIPGVTTILGDGLPKPALVGWGIRSVAEYAVDHWSDLDGMLYSQRLTALKGAPYAARDAAANRGTQVHAIAEQLIHGETVDVPAELTGHVNAYCDFLVAWDPQPVEVERTVVNYTVGYAGTFDLIAEIRGETWLCDIKTSRGVYGETGLQLAAYRYGEVMLVDGVERDMWGVDQCAVIHVRHNGYSFIPVRADAEVFTTFRYVAKVAEAAKNLIPTLLDEPLDVSA